MRRQLLVLALAAISLGLVAARPQFQRYRVQPRLPPLAHRLPQHREPPASGLRAAVREVEEVKSLGLAQLSEEAFGSLSMLKSRDEIIGERYHNDNAARLRKIRGIVLNEAQKPLPRSVLRLRNLETGRLAATLSADESGQFAFSGLGLQNWIVAATVPLLVEVLDSRGRVIATAVSHIQQGDEADLEVRVAGAALGIERGADDLFVSHAEEVVAAAVRSGITYAAVSRAPPASPSR